MVYIRQHELPGLKKYKYSGVDHSLVSRYILKPFWWSQVIKVFPLSMAPNAITLSGFGFVILNILTLLYYNPTLDAVCPSWVYASWSLGLFLYQTFDAIDGTQARRTHQSGPLGELFDHGVDALNTALEVLLFAATMRFGQSWRTVLVLFASLLTFYVQTWEEYHTKTLTLGLVSGPVEGVLSLCAVYAWTAFQPDGGSYWLRPVLGALGIGREGVMAETLPAWVWEMDFGDFFMVYGGLVLVFNTVESSRNVLTSRRTASLPSLPAFLGLLPFFTTWGLITTYLFLNPATLTTHLIPATFYIGLVNAYAVGQIIVAHLVLQPFPYQNILALPLLFGVLESLGPVFAEKGFGVGGWGAGRGEGVGEMGWVYVALAWAVAGYGFFVVDVITAICDYLDIWCLTIKHPFVEGEGKGEGKKAL